MRSAGYLATAASPANRTAFARRRLHYSRRGSRSAAHGPAAETRYWLHFDLADTKDAVGGDQATDTLAARTRSIMLAASFGLVTKLHRFRHMGRNRRARSSAQTLVR